MSVDGEHGEVMDEEEDRIESLSKTAKGEGKTNNKPNNPVQATAPKKYILIV